MDIPLPESDTLDTLEAKLVLIEVSDVKKSYLPLDIGHESSLNIIEIDETRKKLTVMYGGAPSGVYQVEVSNLDG